MVLFAGEEVEFKSGSAFVNFESLPRPFVPVSREAGHVAGGDFLRERLLFLLLAPLVTFRSLRCRCKLSLWVRFLFDKGPAPLSLSSSEPSSCTLSGTSIISSRIEARGFGRCGTLSMGRPKKLSNRQKLPARVIVESILNVSKSGIGALLGLNELLSASSAKVLEDLAPVAWPVRYRSICWFKKFVVDDMPSCFSNSENSRKLPTEMEDMRRRFLVMGPCSAIICDCNVA
mmetsp:Transcript_2146/g.3564  ORF Transcript_2146/g.3564 Transcript_2146/m.3564 type:complete len:231 (+) Transcript_2146:1565-2257(+)